MREVCTLGKMIITRPWLLISFASFFCTMFTWYRAINTFSLRITYCKFTFFLSGFFSLPMTIHKAVREGKEPIPFYHVHSLINNKTFTCNFTYKMNTAYFYSHRLSSPDSHCCSLRFTTLLNYNLINW